MPRGRTAGNQSDVLGLDEIQPGQPFTNLQRLNQEYNDLLGTLEMMAEDADIELYRDVSLIIRKREKLKKFMAYSREQGCLSDEPPSHVSRLDGRLLVTRSDTRCMDEVIPQPERQ
jgi:hypothetical protein